MKFSQLTRPDLLRAGMYGVGVTAGALPLPLFAQANAALAAQGKHDGKILVVLELSGGNDGLNTLVPYGDDAYYKHRPHIGVPKKELRPIDDHFGFSGGMAGFERLYKEGKLAVVHGCGYENPSFSHFTSMAYWHTAAPNRGEEYGWGWLARRFPMAPDATPNFLVNTAAWQSLAVRSRHHVPVVFDDPNKFTQEKFYEEREILDAAPSTKPVDNPSRRFLLETAQSAKDASALVREAWAKYHSPVDYGITGFCPRSLRSSRPACLRDCITRPTATMRSIRTSTKTILTSGCSPMPRMRSPHSCRISSASGARMTWW